MPTFPRQPRPPRAIAAARPLRLAAALGVLGVLGALGACSDEPTAAARAPSAAPQAAAAASRAAAAERQDLATLRAATARFHRYEVADAAGYSFLFMNACMADVSGADRGGMGFHWVNAALLDGTVDVATPEALLYEPGPEGQRRLVGVEYVIPQSMWRGSEPPRLFGRDFTLNAFGLWALHVWVWKHNPSGLYADWNPRVSCEHAPAVAAGAHH